MFQESPYIYTNCNSGNNEEYCGFGESGSDHVSSASFSFYIMLALTTLISAINTRSLCAK